MKFNKLLIAIPFLVLIHLSLLISIMSNGTEMIKLFPIILLASCFIIGFFHKPIDTRFATYSTIVYLSSFALQAVGVNTGAIFGQFFYGNNLGFIVFDTPLITGLLWLVLSYGSSITVEFILLKIATTIHPILKALLASFVILVLVFLLENIAGPLDFWYWKYQTAPLQNYTAWFVFSLAFNFLFQKLEIDATNKIALWYMLIITTFLSALNIMPIA